MADYEFRYSPLTGRLTGNQMIEQTEQAINGLAKLVDEAAGQVTIISTLANEANENAANALEIAEEALATTGRTYITVSTQADADDYYDSELIYIADSTSTNIPVADTGMLEAKTNDTKTACEQVFIADSSGEAYYRNGSITAETVGDVTTYTVEWGGWSSPPASQAYVQQEVNTGVSAAVSEAVGTAKNYTDGVVADYLPLTGGTITGNLTVSGTITDYAKLNSPAFTGSPTAPTQGVGDNSTKIATTAFVRSIVPTGVVQAYAGNGSIPAGWLSCDGSAVSRTTYSALFAVIGTLYGAGNGSTTFNLPNLTDKFVEGGATAQIGSRYLPGIPNVYGNVTGVVALSSSSYTGSIRFSQTDTTNYALTYQSGSMRYGQFTVDASKSSSLYKSDYGVIQPDAIKMRYIIKY